MDTLSTHTQPFFEWLLRSTIQAGMVICLILLIQALLRNRLTARWHYALWLILVVRMVLPWAPQSRFSIYNLTAWQTKSNVPAQVATEADVEPAKAPRESSVGPPITAETEPAATAEGQITHSPAAIGASRAIANSAAHTLFGFSGVLPFVWLAGAVLLGGYIVVCNLRLWRAASGECPSTDKETLDLLEECRAAMGLRTIVALVPSEKVNTPILLGFVRPRLLVPRNITKKLTREELRYVFLHELAHVKRHDIALGWLTALLQVLHWFNPLVWLAFHRMRSNRESACDALVLSRMQGDGAQNYGLAIVSLLEHFSVPQPLPGLAGILESKSQLKRRIAMITQFKHNSYRWSPLAAVLIVVLACISLPDATRGTVSPSTAPQAKPAMTMRMVQKEIEDHVSISPDGRYLCGCGTWAEAGDGIIIRALATGVQQTLKPTKGTPQESGPQYPVLSPDNKMVVYAVMIQPKGGEVRLIGIDGSGQRVLSTAPVLPIQWFPDGRHLLGLRWLWPKGAFTDIEIVSVSIPDSSIESIKTLTGDFFRTTIRLSPDAKYVAYEVTSKDAPTKHDIFAIEIDSKRETPLVVHAADDRLLGWTPDGNQVLFLSDRAGSWSAWLLPFARDQGPGTPELVARSTGDIKPVGFAENGSYYYRMRYSAGDIYTAAINMTTGQVLSAPAPLEAAGSNRVAAWSPDGKYLAYCSSPVTSNGPRVIRIRSLETGQERELANKLTDFTCLRWSPDGRSLLASDLVAYKPEETSWPSRVCRIDVATGESTILLEEKNNYAVMMAELSPDGSTLFYNTGLAIIRREMATGQEKEIFQYTSKAPWAAWALSPDGEFIAAGCNEVRDANKSAGWIKKVLLITPQDGHATELLRWDEPAGYLTNMSWSPDGKSVLFTLHKNEKQTDEFWQVATDGGQPRKIMETKSSMGRPYGLRVHPDGQRIVFSESVVHGELWAMENFLPAGAGAKDTK